MLYATLCVVTGPGVLTVAQLKVLVIRCISLAATAGLGTCYWRLVRRGRREETRPSWVVDEAHALAAEAVATC